MPSCPCPKCGTPKTRLAPRYGVAARLLGALTIYPFRCQLCTHRFTSFLGKLKTNPRRNYERIPVQYPAQVRPINDQVSASSSKERCRICLFGGVACARVSAFQWDVA